MKSKRHCFHLLMLFVALCIQAQKQPNIIYILTDDLGIGDLKAFNPDSKIKTPHLDAFASEGMVFTDAHTSSSVCTPTRYGIITGRYNWRSPLKSIVVKGTSKALIPNNRTTVASIMKANGYQTAMIGKSHLGWNWGLKNGKNEGYYLNKKQGNIQESNIDFTKPVTHTPNDIGFEYHFGSCASLDMPPYVYIENRMPTSSNVSKMQGMGGYKMARGGMKADDFELEDVLPNYVARSAKYIEEHANQKKPFFLYVPLPSPHTPILPKNNGKVKVN